MSEPFAPTPRRSRLRPPPPSKTPQRLALGLALVVVVGIGVWSLVGLFQPDVVRRARLELRGLDGVPVRSVALDVFEFNQSPSSLSPPRLLRTLESVATLHDFGVEDVPREVMVRIRADGYGTSFAVLTPSDDESEVVRRSLGAPTTITARIATGDGLGLSGARVMALGGGRRGVPLVEAQCDAAGQFAIQGIDQALGNVTLRVLVPGHEVFHYTWEFAADEPPVLGPIAPTQPVMGRLVGLETIDRAQLTVCARSVPGAWANVDASGGFTLDHCPADKQVRIVIHGLPADVTYRAEPVSPGAIEQRLTLVRGTTVRGRVLEDVTQRPLADLSVYHPHGPGGLVFAKTDANGYFELALVPPGEVIVSASGEARMDDFVGNFVGSVSVTVVAGRPTDGVTILAR